MLSTRWNQIVLEAAGIATNETLLKNSMLMSRSESVVDREVGKANINALAQQLRFGDSHIDSVYIFKQDRSFLLPLVSSDFYDLFFDSNILQRIRPDSRVIWGYREDVSWQKPSESLIPVLIIPSLVINNDSSSADSIYDVRAIRVLILLDWERIRRDLQEIIDNFQAVVSIYDGEYLVAASAKSLDRSYERPSELFHSTIGVNGWTLEVAVSRSAMYRQISFLLYCLVAIFLATTGIAMLIFRAMIIRFVSPLLSLTRVMRMGSADVLNLRYLPRTHDEVGELGRTFNRLLDEIQNLVSELSEEHELLLSEQREKSRHELANLQNQMNPHFLYNVLNALYWKAMLAGQDQIAEIVNSLSEFYRLGLKKENLMGTVAQEAEHARLYAEIQRDIYTIPFEVHVDVQEEVAECPCPGFILQPLVENAILHGFEGRSESKNRIEVIANRFGRSMCRIVVRDNGNGFDDGNGLNSGYAIRNLQRRFLLYYGEDGLVEIRSAKGAGTTVVLNVPQKQVAYAI